MKRIEDIRLVDSDRRAIEAAAAVLRKHLPVEKVILYGSKARGDDQAESDVDLLVLTNRSLTPEEEDRVVELLYPLELEYGVPLTSIEIARTDWEKGLYQVLPFRAEVERDGVLV